MNSSVAGKEVTGSRKSDEGGMVSKDPPFSRFALNVPRVNDDTNTFIFSLIVDVSSTPGGPPTSSWNLIWIFCRRTLFLIATSVIFCCLASTSARCLSRRALAVLLFLCKRISFWFAFSGHFFGLGLLCACLLFGVVTSLPVVAIFSSVSWFAADDEVLVGDALRNGSGRDEATRSPDLDVLPVIPIGLSGCCQCC